MSTLKRLIEGNTMNIFVVNLLVFSLDKTFVKQSIQCNKIYALSTFYLKNQMDLNKKTNK